MEHTLRPGNYIVLCKTAQQCKLLLDRLAQYYRDKNSTMRYTKRRLSELVIYDEFTKIRFVPEVKSSEAIRGFHGKLINGNRLERMLDNYDREQREIEWYEAMLEVF